MHNHPDVHRCHRLAIRDGPRGTERANRRLRDNFLPVLRPAALRVAALAGGKVRRQRRTAQESRADKGLNNSDRRDAEADQ